MEKRIPKETIHIGEKIRIRHLLQHDQITKTPLWARGMSGIVIRKNINSVTIDVLDGQKNIYVDYMDLYYETKEN